MKFDTSIFFVPSKWEWTSIILLVLGWNLIGSGLDVVLWFYESPPTISEMLQIRKDAQSVENLAWLLFLSGVSTGGYALIKRKREGHVLGDWAVLLVVIAAVVFVLILAFVIFGVFSGYFLGGGGGQLH